jgi:hypothetical protein
MFTKIQIQLFFNNYYFCRNLNISLSIIFSQFTVFNPSRLATRRKFFK